MHRCFACYTLSLAFFLLLVLLLIFLFFFFFNDTATTEIYTLSLHDALPICGKYGINFNSLDCHKRYEAADHFFIERSEEHTSELQSPVHLVCRLLLEKKKKNKQTYKTNKTNHTYIRTSHSVPRDFDMLHLYL